MSSDILLNVTGLSKYYRSYRSPGQRLREILFGGKVASCTEIPALRDISLDLRRGEIMGVIGPNGSGKSTLLQMIAGTLRPSAGHVQLNGRLTALLELGAGVDPQMTGRENIFLMAATHGLPRDVALEKVDAIVAFSGLGDFIERPVKTYSSGMFVRLAFSVSTALDPDVLIVDEALAVGDVGFQAKCLDRLEQLIRGGSSILLASHDMQLIKTYCSSALCLNKGELLASGDPELVTERYYQLMRSGGSLLRSDLHWKNESGKLARFGGTDRGVIDAIDVDTPSRACTLEGGQTATVTVAGRVFDDTVVPAVSVMLRDARGYNLYGLMAKVTTAAVPPAEDQHFSASFSIPMHVAKGNYSFTVRLLDHRTNHVSALLDKHIGVCPVSVSTAEQHFLGAVNLFGAVDDKPRDPMASEFKL